MDNDRCFCHLNGYAVKDAAARKSLEELAKITDDYTEIVREKNEGKILTFWVGTTAEYNALKEHVLNCIYIKTDDTELEDYKTELKSMVEKYGVESEEYPGCFYRVIDGKTYWINPPLVPWKNYITTEKFDGKNVYVVTSDYPMEETSGTESFALTNSLLSTTGANIVSIEGAVVDAANMVSYPLNTYDQNGGYCYVAVAGRRVDVTHSAAYAAMNVRMKIKYVVG